MAFSKIRFIRLKRIFEIELSLSLKEEELSLAGLIRCQRAEVGDQQKKVRRISLARPEAGLESQSPQRGKGRSRI